MTTQARRPPASPCVNICVIDEARGRCTGCARTLDEIAVWGSASDAFRAEVWAALPARAAAEGFVVRRLEWQGTRILDEVEQRIALDGETLVAGVYGAVAEVMRHRDEPCETSQRDMALSLVTPRAALRIEAAPWISAFEIARPGGLSPLIALAVPRGRTGAAGPSVLTDLGPDTAALLPRAAGGRRFNLGLGRRAATFTIRCADDLTPRIAPHCGTLWPECLARIGTDVVAASPVRVIEAPCLRAEVDAVIPPPGGTSPDGPHTHLLPDHIAQGFDTPPNVPLPEGYVLTALIYPR